MPRLVSLVSRPETISSVYVVCVVERERGGEARRFVTNLLPLSHLYHVVFVLVLVSISRFLFSTSHFQLESLAPIDGQIATIPVQAHKNMNKKRECHYRGTLCT